MCRRVLVMSDLSNIEKYQNVFVESFDIEKAFWMKS